MQEPLESHNFPEMDYLQPGEYQQWIWDPIIFVFIKIIHTDIFFIYLSYNGISISSTLNTN